MSQGDKGILDAIGHTPLVRLQRMVPAQDGVVLCKLEFLNPGGSVKDRLALAIITDAEERGLLHPGDTILEATSGNSGISLAMVAAVKGYHLILVMPEDVGPERRRLFNRSGAELHLTPSTLGMPGARSAAHRMASQNPGYFLPRIFENQATVRWYRATFAQEILDVTQGKVDAFVAAVGTGATITGVGGALKARNPKVRVIAVEPKTSPVLSNGRAGEHRIPGIGADFVPPLLDRKLVDQIISVSDEDAYLTADGLAKEEGILVGPSSGANVFAALQVAQQLGAGKQVVTVLPDSAERYTGLTL